VLVAPVIEETLKALFPLLLFVFYRRAYTGIIDGIVYCGLSPPVRHGGEHPLPGWARLRRGREDRATPPATLAATSSSSCGCR
jgi:hypothetical protein